MTTLIVYIHGFASSGKSIKSLTLYENFAHHDVVAPDFPVTPDEVERQVADIVNDHVRRNGKIDQLIFVGTSLGGFWANYFAQRYDAIAVAVNPSIQPSVTLAQHVGKKLKNYSSGKHIKVTEEDLAQFKIREDYLKSNSNGYLLHLFLARDDDVLPFEPTLKALRFARTTTVTDTGGHRYDTEWYRVVAKVRDLVDLQIA